MIQKQMTPAILTTLRHMEKSYGIVGCEERDIFFCLCFSFFLSTWEEKSKPEENIRTVKKNREDTNHHNKCKIIQKPTPSNQMLAPYFWCPLQQLQDVK